MNDGVSEILEGREGGAEAVTATRRPMDRAAAAEMILAYQDRLYGAIYRVVNNSEDAAELVQETFLRALQKWEGFEGRSSLYTWLFRIAMNLALSHRRGMRYRAAVSLDQEGGGGEQERGALRGRLGQRREKDPAEAVVLKAEHQRLVAALGALEPEARAMVVLRDMEECDYRQIAVIMGVPVGTIKSRLFRARNGLRAAAGRRRAEAMAG